MEYWSFLLFAGLTLGASYLIYPALVMVAWALLIVPYWAVTVRRLHDTGHSAAAFLVAFIPWIGGFIFIYWMAKGSQDGDTIHGRHPNRPGTAPLPLGPAPDWAMPPHRATAD